MNVALLPVPQQANFFNSSSFHSSNHSMLSACNHLFNWITKRIHLDTLLLLLMHGLPPIQYPFFEIATWALLIRKEEDNKAMRLNKNEYFSQSRDVVSTWLIFGIEKLRRQLPLVCLLLVKHIEHKIVDKEQRKGLFICKQFTFERDNHPIIPCLHQTADKSLYIWASTVPIPKFLVSAMYGDCDSIH